MALIFIAFYIITQRSLLSHTDTAITSHTEKIVEIISREDVTSMDKSFVDNSQTFARQFSEMPGMLLIVGDAYGNILYTSQNLGGNEKVVSELLERSANIIKPTFVNRAVGSSSVRLGIFPAERSDEVKALVIMGQPMDVIQSSLNTLALTLVVVYAGVFILMVAGGFILAGQAMNPIALISKQLKKISAENLKERVPNPKTGDELEELSLTFNGLLDHLNEAFIRERQFIGDVAHELKTPLATLKTSIEVTMAKARTSDEYKKALAETLVDVNRLSSTVKNILDLAWIGADNAQIEEKHVHLSGIMKDLFEIAEKLAAQKKTKIKATIAPGVVVHGIEDKIFRAILNVIDNAIKYTPEGNMVSLTLRKNKHLAFIRVKDTGIGIPIQDQQHIFDRFYRGSKVARTVGSGLGLAIAQEIIKAHRGTISVTSSVGKGTDVIISLPLASDSS